MTDQERIAELESRLFDTLKTAEGWVYEIADLKDQNNALRDALKPFAAMDRPDCDLSELSCQRGIASDMTIITSRDFRNARAALSGVPATQPDPHDRIKSDMPSRIRNEQSDPRAALIEKLGEALKRAQSVLKYTGVSECAGLDSTLALYAAYKAGK